VVHQVWDYVGRDGGAVSAGLGLRWPDDECPIDELVHRAFNSERLGEWVEAGAPEGEALTSPETVPRGQDVGSQQSLVKLTGPTAQQRR